MSGSIINRLKSLLSFRKRIDKGNSLSIHHDFIPRHGKISVSGKNNHIQLGSGTARNINILISGTGNELTIGNNSKIREINIQIIGNNCRVHLADDIQVVEQLDIYNHYQSKSTSINIGKGTSFFRSKIYNYDNDSRIIIGDDCMFGYNTVLYNSDGHAILQNGSIINKAREIKLGNHVWLGENAQILKNASVGHGCIVGRGAMVTKTFYEVQNAILVGIPARIQKTDIEWTRSSINELEA